MGGSAAAQLAGDSPELAELGSIIGESIWKWNDEGLVGSNDGFINEIESIIDAINRVVELVNKGRCVYKYKT